jgi:hypothetical protein
MGKGLPDEDPDGDRKQARGPRETAKGRKKLFHVAT